MRKVPAITILENVSNISSKKKDQVDFLHADKHQTFLRVDLMVSVLLRKASHSKSTRKNKFAKSLHYLKKEVREVIDFWCR